jgi:hypothetical protein
MEECRSKCRQSLRRLKSRKSPAADAVEQIGVEDPSSPEAWQFEQFGYECLARQLRSVGDALAWRCYHFDRRAILALSRNDSPGPMYGKEGLPFELGRVDEIWKKDGHFTLFHDITNCLRIADLSEIELDGRVWLREIKAQLRTDSRQMARAQAAIDAVSNLGPLPGSDARFVELTTPYRTSIGRLRDAVQLAKRDGVRGMKLPQGRALVIVSLLDAQQRFKDDIDAAALHHTAERSRALKRAGIEGSVHHLTGVSADTACRSPHSVPWAIYPLESEDCAALICDRMSFEVIVSVDERSPVARRRSLRTRRAHQPSRRSSRSNTSCATPCLASHSFYASRAHFAAASQVLRKTERSARRVPWSGRSQRSSMKRHHQEPSHDHPTAAPSVVSRSLSTARIGAQHSMTVSASGVNPSCAWRRGCTKFR